MTLYKFPPIEKVAALILSQIIKVAALKFNFKKKVAALIVAKVTV